MLEDHYYWCVALERWLYDDARDILTFFPPTLYPKWLPKAVVNFMLKRYGKSIILPQTHGQGMGRHSQHEVEEFGR